MTSRRADLLSARRAANPPRRRTRSRLPRPEGARGAAAPPAARPLRLRPLRPRPRAAPPPEGGRRNQWPTTNDQTHLFNRFAHSAGLGTMVEASHGRVWAGRGISDGNAIRSPAVRWSFAAGVWGEGRRQPRPARWGPNLGWGGGGSYSRRSASSLNKSRSEAVRVKPEQIQARGGAFRAWKFPGSRRNASSLELSRLETHRLGPGFVQV